MTQERIERLESIAFEWDPLSAEWDTKVNELVAYKDAHGEAAMCLSLRQIAIWQVGKHSATAVQEVPARPLTSSMTQERRAA